MNKPNERGAVGGFEGLAFGVLIFVMGSLLVANAWILIDTKLATTAASKEAVRVLVEASERVSGEHAAGEVANTTMQGHGIDSVRVSIDSGGFTRCAPTTVTVAAEVPTVAIPLLGGAGGSRTVSSSHSEIVDPYRAGLPGAAQCSIP